MRLECLSGFRNGPLLRLDSERDPKYLFEIGRDREPLRASDGVIGNPLPFRLREASDRGGFRAKNRRVLNPYGITPLSDTTVDCPTSEGTLGGGCRFGAAPTTTISIPEARGWLNLTNPIRWCILGVVVSCSGFFLSPSRLVELSRPLRF